MTEFSGCIFLTKNSKILSLCASFILENRIKVKIRKEPFLKKGDTFLDFDDWWQLIIDRVFYCANIWCTIIMIRAASIVAASLCTINSFVKHCPEIVNGILLPKLFWPTVRKIILVIEKNFWNSRLKAENFAKILRSLLRTIYSNSERSEQFWVT